MMTRGFVQSVRDSPCAVRVAGGKSLFSLSKWGGHARLDFAPGETHSGTVRASREEIRLNPYDRKREEHVFRRLDADRFEYDLVLLSEPETNQFILPLDFPEGLEFYRQPDEREAERIGLKCDPSLYGSYAVYWKERNGLFKTGKFCHIHRPLAYDTRGRKWWGEIWIRGSELILEISEAWLADAQYPVVIDPIIGTQTPGAYDTIDWFNSGTPDGFFWDNWMGVNGFTASGLIGGACTGYIYIAYNQSGQKTKAAIYSHSGGVPATRLSRNESWVDLGNPTPAWKASTFTLSRNIEPAEHFWFGFYPEYGFETHYDFGGDFRRGTIYYTDDPPTTFDPDPVSFNVLSSMYFVAPDPKSLARSMNDTIGLAEIPRRNSSLHRKGLGGLGITESASRILRATRKKTDGCGISETFGIVMGIARMIDSVLQLSDTMHRLGFWMRRLSDGLSGLSISARSVGIIRMVTSLEFFFGRVTGRFILRKDELIIVSRITREIEVRSDFV